ncbi:unnamed protein product [Brassica oleracea]
MKLCRCIDVCRLRRRLRFASVSSPSSSVHHFCRRLRITYVVVCASPPSSSAHSLRRRLRIASVVVCASPPHRLRSVLICALPLHCLRSVLVITSSPSTMMSSPRDSLYAGKKEDRMMMTKLHTVVDIYFVKYGSYVRWIYHLTVTLGVMDPPYYTPDCILENLVKEAKDKAISEISVTNVKVPSFSVANSSFSFTYSQLSSEMHFLSRLLLLQSQLHLFNVLDPGWEFSVSILQSSVTIVNGEIHDDYIAVSGVVDFE